MTRIAILDDYQSAALGYRQAVEDIKAWLAGDPIRVLNAAA